MLPPLSLYIHFPWCERKCPYCDFNSHTTTTIPQQQYADALINDLRQSLHHLQQRPINSIFFGGGTPSLISVEALASIFKALKQHLLLSTEVEITLEANPGSAERDKFQQFYELGINRLSIGVQSFQDDALQALGRIHSSRDAVNAIESAQRAGFDNINLDLMVGLPDQLPLNALDDLQRAIDFDTKHISWYELTIEPNTAFYSQPPLLPIENYLLQMERQGRQLLLENNFQRYEISAYCRPQYQAKHNLNYWHYGDYLGIGAGAHSKISRLDDGGQLVIQRFSKRRQPPAYMQSQQPSTMQIVEYEDRLSDYLLNGLRVINGFNIEQCLQRSGLRRDDLTNALKRLQQQAFINVKNGRATPTVQGLHFQNEAIIKTL